MIEICQRTATEGASHMRLSYYAVTGHSSSVQQHWFKVIMMANVLGTSHSKIGSADEEF